MTKERAERIRLGLLEAARDLGHEVLHSWVFDFEDGSFNVKAIVRLPEGRGTTTVGYHVQ